MGHKVARMVGPWDTVWACLGHRCESPLTDDTSALDGSGCWRFMGSRAVVEEVGACSPWAALTSAWRPLCS